MNTLPLFFKLDNQAVLIVGGGEVATRKADLMMRAGASITVVAPEICTELATLLADDKHTLIYQPYQQHFLEGKRFIIACTNQKELNQRIYIDAKLHNIAINVVDTPELCDFIFPAIVDRNPIVIGISSNGKAPVLARLLRAKIETIIPQHYGKLASLAGSFRQQVKQTLPTLTKRRQFWETIFSSRVADLVFAGNQQQAKIELEKTLQQMAQASKLQNGIDDNINDNHHNDNPPHTHIGEVAIVGAGAGDPELLTFKALRLMQQADVVLYDALVSDKILDLCRRDAHKVYVGKKRSQHTFSQEQINQKLIDYAKQGKRVVRLKGGDPLIFGRGGEEMQALKEHNIPYQVVAGITSATAASSYAGIPLTHRHIANSVRFITACLKSGELNQNIQTLLNPDETVVIYMGLHNLENFVNQLVQAGRDDSTPIAIVSNASLETQQVLTGTLKDIVAKQATAKLPAPAVIIIGEVVTLHQKLAWYHPNQQSHDVINTHTNNDQKKPQLNLQPNVSEVMA